MTKDNELDINQMGNLVKAFISPGCSVALKVVRLGTIKSRAILSIVDRGEYSLIITSKRLSDAERDELLDLLNSAIGDEPYQSVTRRRACIYSWKVPPHDNQ